MSELFSFFLKTDFRSGYKTDVLLQLLLREQDARYRNVNRALEELDADGLTLLEEMDDFQSRMPSSKRFAQIQDEYAKTNQRAEAVLERLEESNAFLDNLKIAVCRYIVDFERPLNSSLPKLGSVEEWMDAASLAEMRLQKQLNPQETSQLGRLLPHFVTFRSIICSYHGPASIIRQIKILLSSMDTLFEKIALKMRAYTASKRLIETTKELSTVKLDLDSVQSELARKQFEAEKLSKLIYLREKTNFPMIVGILALCLLVGAAIAYYLRIRASVEEKRLESVINETSCKDIYYLLEKNPKYRRKSLVFKKYGQEIYFGADHITCEKLHKLDSIQINALSTLLDRDHERHMKSLPFESEADAYPTLRIKQLGITKLAFHLQSHTSKDLDFKVKVLELANAMRAQHYPAEDTTIQDFVVIDLSMKPIAPKYK